MSWDLADLFRVDVSLVELVVRTSIIYLMLIALMRMIAQREMGALQLPDLLLVVLVADGVQNGMSGDYGSVTGALVVALTLVSWNYALDWLAYHSRFMRRLIRPRELKLVEDGRLLRRNMRKEMITEEELWNHLRVQGVERLSEVKRVCLEADGELSVLKHDRTDAQPPRRRAPS
jgi:uncharacterized membrane protein YcaP (DUF421 family)